MSRKPRVLFICRHNSGRSQIAEAYLRKFAGQHFEAHSAGLEPADRVHPLLVAVIREEGIDLSDKKPRSVFELFKAGELFSHVITVCHDSESQCPVFPGIAQRWYSPFPDPAQAEGSPEEQLAQVRVIRDAIKDWLLKPPDGAFSFKMLIEE